MMYNTFKTGILLVIMAAILLLIGGALGGRSGMFIALLLALGVNFASYWYSDKMVLGLYGAQEVTEPEAPVLYGIIRHLAQRAQLPMPRVYLMPAAAPNAFATGRDPQHAAVAVTEGILQMLDRQELEGVLAHELAHIKNRDTLIMTITATLASAIMFVANMAQWAALFGGFSRDEDDDGSGGWAALLVGIIIAPIAATLVQMAISRSREFAADAMGAQIAGSPYGLANALEKLTYANERTATRATPATAHLFIVNPLRGRSFATLFSTHPAIEERVRRLRGMVHG